MESVPGRINPRKPSKPGEKNFLVTFRHPNKGGKVVTKSLGTDNALLARKICDDIETFCSRPDLWEDSNPRLGFYNSRAVAIFFDKKTEAVEEQRKPVLDSTDVDTLKARILHEYDRCTEAEFSSALDEILKNFYIKDFEELKEKSVKNEEELKGARTELEITHNKLAKYEAKESIHVREKCSTAFEVFGVEYKKDVKRDTAKATLSAVEEFLATLPPDMKLRDVNKDHVNEWLSKFKSMAPMTQHHRKYALSAFFRFCMGKFHLFVNPVAAAEKIRGVLKRDGDIDAMRLKEITSLLDALKENVYWQSWAAFAILAGPRWGEQAALHISSVNLEDREIKIHASKTERARRVPIETTTLLPILRKYLQWRVKEQKAKKASPALKSNYLFPSIIGENPYMPRKLTVTGPWSGRSAWHGAWESCKPVVDEEQGEELPKFWQYGPMEWRHSFGTCLGQCGWTAIEIANKMGNSPDVCQRHYVAVAEAGKRWPFRW